MRRSSSVLNFMKPERNKTNAKQINKNDYIEKHIQLAYGFRPSVTINHIGILILYILINIPAFCFSLSSFSN